LACFDYEGRSKEVLFLPPLEIKTHPKEEPPGGWGILQSTSIISLKSKSVNVMRFQFDDCVSVLSESESPAFGRATMEWCSESRSRARSRHWHLRKTWKPGNESEMVVEVAICGGVASRAEG